MKKIVPPSLFAILFFLASIPAFAREEASAPALGPGFLQESAPAGDIPFEVSVMPGKWSQAKAGKVFTSGYHPSDFTLPVLGGDPVPIHYPRWAVREGWQGTFVIAVEVLKSGKVGRWRVMRSTGYKLLDETAANAIRHWYFYPGTERGQPVVMCIQIPVRFELQQ